MQHTTGQLMTGNAQQHHLRHPLCHRHYQYQTQQQQYPTHNQVYGVEQFGQQPVPLYLAGYAAPSEAYYSPYTQYANAQREYPFKATKGMFQVNMDVQNFAPEEVTVKIAGSHIVVDAKHEEKQDEYGYISRQFTRRYPLPEGYDPKSVESRMSIDGVLTVTAPMTSADEIIVPITQIGAVRTDIKKRNEVIVRT